MYVDTSVEQEGSFAVKASSFEINLVPSVHVAIIIIDRHKVI